MRQCELLDGVYSETLDPLSQSPGWKGMISDTDVNRLRSIQIDSRKRVQPGNSLIQTLSECVLVVIG
jgi:hypothetical protein